jgi:hypothetical protein
MEIKRREKRQDDFCLFAELERAESCVLQQKAKQQSEGI